MALASKSLRPPADRAPDGTQQPAWVVVVGSRRALRGALNSRRRRGGHARTGCTGPEGRGGAGHTRVWFHFCGAFRGRFLSHHRTESEVGASDFGVSDGVRASHTPRRVHTSQCAAGSVTSPFPRGGAEAARRSTLSLPAPPPVQRSRLSGPGHQLTTPCHLPSPPPPASQPPPLLLTVASAPSEPPTWPQSLRARGWRWCRCGR